MSYHRSHRLFFWRLLANRQGQRHHDHHIEAKAFVVAPGEEMHPAMAGRTIAIIAPPRQPTDQLENMSVVCYNCSEFELNICTDLIKLTVVCPVIVFVFLY
jgi:hypothetical protein